jgi:ATP-binding cassette, subfamily G (WHITE), eye pigment precursor transporter
METESEDAPLLREIMVESNQTTRNPNGGGYGTHSPAGSNGSVVTISPSRKSSTESVTLSWDNVSAFVKESRKGCRGLCCCKSSEESQKQILHNVSGIVKPGTLLAILGASGAGKTTLLNILNQRNIRALEVTGNLRVNGMKFEREITSISGYVQQDDVFIGRLTVRDHLWFHAMLRMDRNCGKQERMRRIEEVIQELGLSKCANTLIGIPGRIAGISGGERKRLAFASEVMTNPSLLFCDEPTSGLDSFMAENVVHTLRVMASKGKTVICTIHQPSSQVYALFDKILLMAEGRVAYMGKTDGLTDFFGNLGVYCPPSFNPADYYIHALAVIPGREEATRTKINIICDAYEKSPQFDEMQTDLQKIAAPANEPEFTVRTTKKRSAYRASWWTQFWVLLWRSFTTIVREPVLSRSKIINTIIIGVVFGLIYLNQTYDQKGVMNINGVLFLLQAQLSFGSVFPVVNTFIAEFPVFIREHHNGMYQTGLYYISKILAEMPIYIITPIIFSSIAYWMIGLYGDPITFLIATGTLLLVCNCAVSYGYMMSCISSNLNVVLALAPMLLVPLMLFGGLFINSGSIPVYFVWFRYISWFSYSNEIMVVNQWRNVKNITCDVPPHDNTVDAPSGFSTRCFTDGKSVIDSMSFSEDNLWLDFVLLATLLVGFRVLSYILLFLRTRRRE